MSRSRRAGRRTLLPFALFALFFPRGASAQDARFWEDIAFWGEFIYTLQTWDRVEWTITPWIRTDEQELNSGTMTRVTTEAWVDFGDGWDIRNRYFAIGRKDEAQDEVVLDHRLQFFLRKLLGRIADDRVRVRGGIFYERHFRSDVIEDFNVYRTRVELRADGIRYEPWTQLDFFWDSARGFFRTRSRTGVIWRLRNAQEIRLAYQFQYTQDRSNEWKPQHAVVFRYWFGSKLSRRRGD